MFTDSRRTRTSCLDCTHTQTSVPLSPSVSRSAGQSVSVFVNPSSTTTRLDPTFQEDYKGNFTKTNSTAYIPTPSTIVVSNCKKEYGKKIVYLGYIYSYKQIKRSKKKYRKRMFVRVKRERNLCSVICK